MTLFLFQLLTTKNCSKWERSLAVFACRTLVITSRIAPFGQMRWLNLNYCGWFEIIAKMPEMRDDELPYQPKPVKELTFPSISICQKWYFPPFPLRYPHSNFETGGFSSHISERPIFK
jgi:hypothetical protein